jgi:hypothetical protein
MLREVVKDCHVHQQMHWIAICHKVAEAQTTIGFMVPGQSVQNFVKDELKKYAKNEPTPPVVIAPVAVMPRGEDIDENTEDWVSTLEYPKKDRLDLIYNYLVTRPKGQTRAQIEIGAGYRQDGDVLPLEEYRILKRKILRDLDSLIDAGEILKDTRPNPKHRKGYNDEIVLYFANAPEGEIPETDNFTPQVRKHLYQALEAFDDKDADAVADHLLEVLTRVAPLRVTLPPRSTDTPCTQL